VPAFAFRAAARFLWPHSASAQWPRPLRTDERNLDNRGEPSFIDVKMIGRGDESLNGAQAQGSRYAMRAWVKQSSGQFYGRPTVNATYRPWNGTKWL
jgi:hypothetical protein